MNRCRTLWCLPVVLFTVEILPYFFHSSQEVFPFFSAIPAIFVRHNSSFSLDLPSFSKNTDIFRPRHLLPVIFQFFQFTMLGGFLAGNFMVPAFSHFPLCRCVFLPLYDRGVLLSAAHFAGGCYPRHNLRLAQPRLRCRKVPEKKL